ncbi:hypothetical protein V6N13_087253 [Hibiscus sabdariffa]|uniref:Uncharacterized protein n=1 Tax=Hibiscus sabdariffa TaxID=183260 RepID=A0ABR2FVM8_9ROSI
MENYLKTRGCAKSRNWLASGTYSNKQTMESGHILRFIEIEATTHKVVVWWTAPIDVDFSCSHFYFSNVTVQWSLLLQRPSLKTTATAAYFHGLSLVVFEYMQWGMEDNAPPLPEPVVAGPLDSI